MNVTPRAPRLLLRTNNHLSIARTLTTKASPTLQSAFPRSALSAPFTSTKFIKSAVPGYFANMSQSKSIAAATHNDFNRNSLFDLKGRVALVTGR